MFLNNYLKTYFIYTFNLQRSRNHRDRNTVPNWKSTYFSNFIFYWNTLVILLLIKIFFQFLLT